MYSRGNSLDHSQQLRGAQSGFVAATPCALSLLCLLPPTPPPSHAVFFLSAVEADLRAMQPGRPLVMILAAQAGRR